MQFAFFGQSRRIVQSMLWRHPSLNVGLAGKQLIIPTTWEHGNKVKTHICKCREYWWWYGGINNGLNYIINFLLHQNVVKMIWNLAIKPEMRGGAWWVIKWWFKPMTIIFIIISRIAIIQSFLIYEYVAEDSCAIHQDTACLCQ